MAKPNLKRINEREKKLKTSHTKLTCKYHKFKMNKWKKDEKMLSLNNNLTITFIKNILLNFSL